MPFKKTFDLPEPVKQPACIDLRSKRMYVTGDFESREEAEAEGACQFWCNRTQHVFGPDSQSVDRRTCIAGRDCYSDTR